MLERLADWFDNRTGMRTLARAFRDEPVPGGARWAYVFGSALFVVLVLQFVSGLLLTFYYVPSIDHAHTTVAYIQKEVPLGWLVRGVHNYGASAVIVVLLLHLSQVFLWGAYKDRREALWLVGVILLNILLGFGFTGYLLPWDQKAYFGTQVAGGIAESIPVVGDLVARVLLGGVGTGQATLSRFFSIHVLVLPALTLGLVAMHVYLFRFRGRSGPASDDERTTRRSDPYFPSQFAKDTFAAALLVLLLVGLAARFPALLGPKADPSASFIPRPEWYFLWAFQLLKVFPAFLGGVVAPGLLMTLLAAAPFVDRSPNRSFRARRIPNSLFVFVVLGLAALTASALVEDRANPRIAEQEDAAREYMAAPFTPDRIGSRPTSGEVDTKNRPPAPFVRNCAGCHGATAEGVIGPSLRGISRKPHRTEDELMKVIEDPRAFGLNEKMPAFAGLPESDRREIARWLVSLE